MANESHFPFRFYILEFVYFIYRRATHHYNKIQHTYVRGPKSQWFHLQKSFELKYKM